MSSEVTAKKIMAVHTATCLPVLEARRFMETHAEELIERILLAAVFARRLPLAEAPASARRAWLEGIYHADDGSRHEHSGLRDPIEMLPDVGPIVRQVLDEEEARIREEQNGEWRLGSCHRVWKRTKERLSEDHGITWYSKAEMNPSACFD